MNVSVITTLFLHPVDRLKNLILFSSKSCKVAGFQPLITAAMWTILDAAGFLDPPLTFAFRKKDGYLNFNAIFVYKVYIDF